jgi:uncharacterized protein YcaQ
VEVSAEDARRFFVARQLLSPPRSAAGVLDVFDRLGSVQYDPIAVAGRNHDLVLHARVAGYEPAWCDRLYEQGELFETPNKGLSFVRMRELPWFRPTSARAQRVLDEHADVLAHVLERIRAEGPLSSLDFERKTGSLVDWFGAPTNVVRGVLEAAAVTGVLGLARRDGSRRRYDLIERLVPRDVLEREVPLEERLRHRMLSRYRAHGLLGASPGADILNGLGAAKPDPRFPGNPGRTVIRQRLIDEAAIVPVSVEGVRGPRFVLPGELDLLERPPEPAQSVAFLPPFDPVVWDRPFLGALFGFDYVWELFLPPAKRRWGWYVLPILFGDRLVGRMEPRIERDESTVQVLDLWWEDGFDPRREPGYVDAMRDALRAYLQFAGVSRIEWPARLGKERRLFG